MNDLSAKEAREIAFNLKKDEESSLLYGLFNSIKDAAEEGRFTMNYFTDGKHFSQGELNYLSNLGYSLRWNSPCLWYEVSWE